ncbi:MAG: lytT [Paenibacillus sp.]|nr:lytT [Paenibacillus sp.]
MKAILIDDEKPALQHMEWVLESAPDILVTGKYLSAKDGIAHIQREKTDLVFLDIGMPEMNGLVAAEYIQQLDSSIRIVYITAYTEYAFEAFELHALDYLLKPVEPQRFLKTLERIRAYVPSRSPVIEKMLSPAVLTFGKLVLSPQLDSDRKMKWRTLKTKELFVFLLQHKGEWLSRDLLLDTLWCRFTVDKAMIHLHTSVYQLRKLFREIGIDIKLDFSLDSYRLSADELTTDAELFEQGVAEAKNLRDKRLWLHVNSLLKLYRGHYLEEHDYDWAQPKRDRLRRNYLELSQAAAEYELKAGQAEQAILRLDEMLEREPYFEPVFRLIMTALAQTGNYQQLNSRYETFERLLELELDAEPEPQTRQHYYDLKRSRHNS